MEKTPLIAKLVNHGEYYFLSRLRRFGKSLLIDTIAEAFQGRKELFQGLYLENNWDWSKMKVCGVLFSFQTVNGISGFRSPVIDNKLSANQSGSLFLSFKK